jgi:hypothetical protein
VITPHARFVHRVARWELAWRELAWEHHSRVEWWISRGHTVWHYWWGHSWHAEWHLPMRHHAFFHHRPTRAHWRAHRAHRYPRHPRHRRPIGRPHVWVLGFWILRVSRRNVLSVWSLSLGPRLLVAKRLFPVRSIGQPQLPDQAISFSDPLAPKIISDSFSLRPTPIIGAPNLSAQKNLTYSYLSHNLSPQDHLSNHFFP